MLDPNVTERIRSIFLHHEARVTVEGAAELLGRARGGVASAIDGGDVETVGHLQRDEDRHPLAGGAGVASLAARGHRGGAGEGGVADPAPSAADTQVCGVAAAVSHRGAAEFGRGEWGERGGAAAAGTAWVGVGASGAAGPLHSRIRRACRVAGRRVKSEMITIRQLRSSREARRYRREHGTAIVSLPRGPRRGQRGEGERRFRVIAAAGAGSGRGGVGAMSPPVRLGRGNRCKKGAAAFPIKLASPGKAGGKAVRRAFARQCRPSREVPRSQHGAVTEIRRLHAARTASLRMRSRRRGLMALFITRSTFRPKRPSSNSFSSIGAASSRANDPKSASSDTPKACQTGPVCFDRLPNHVAIMANHRT